MEEKVLDEKMSLKKEKENKIPEFFNISTIEGLIETTTTIPTETVTQFNQQIKIYVDSISAPTTKRLYIYSNKTNSWFYIALS